MFSREGNIVCLDRRSAKDTFVMVETESGEVANTSTNPPDAVGSPGADTADVVVVGVVGTGVVAIGKITGGFPHSE